MDSVKPLLNQPVSITIEGNKGGRDNDKIPADSVDTTDIPVAGESTQKEIQSQATLIQGKPGVTTVTPPSFRDKLKGLVNTSLRLAFGAAGGVLGALTMGIWGAVSGLPGGVYLSLKPSESVRSVPFPLKLTPHVGFIGEKVKGLLEPLTGSRISSIAGGAVGGLTGSLIGVFEGTLLGAVLASSKAARVAPQFSVEELADEISFRPGPPVTVSAVKGPDKIANLDRVIQESGFFSELEKKWKESGKSRDEFLVAVKPNLMMFTHKEDPVATYTDPILVEHLIDRIEEKGFKKIRLVESQNIYGNWYTQRDVKHVADVAGYRPDLHGYEVADLTEEQVPHSYEGILGEHSAGKTWKDADFRISFAKNKTHTSTTYTLTMKNVYGCTPKQDKALEYHGLREWDKADMDMMKAFPVHFGFIDGHYSADGLVGFKGTSVPKKTEIMYGGKDLLAVDWLAASHMGIDPHDSNLMKMAVKQWGRPGIDQVGNLPSGYNHQGWDNIWGGLRSELPEVIDNSELWQFLERKAPDVVARLTDLPEESYSMYNVMGIISNGMSGDTMDISQFPRKTWKELASHIRKGMWKNLSSIVKEKKRRREIWEDIKAGFGA